MMIPTLLGTPQVTLWGGPVVGMGRGLTPGGLRGLGTYPTNGDPSSNLDVRQYGTSWGSYESPASNQILQSLQAQLNRFGAGLTIDGLIGPASVAAVQRIGMMYVGNPTPTVTGGTADYAGTLLAEFAAGGAQQVATRGYLANFYVKSLADTFLPNTKPTTVPTSTSSSPSSTPAKPSTSSVPIVPPGIFPTFPAAPSTSIFADKTKLGIYIAIGVGVLGLATATWIVWK